MNNLKAGFGRVNINPEMGVPIAGYFKKRYVEGYLDNLEANALALSAGNSTVILISADVCGIAKIVLDPLRAEIAKELNLPYENILIGSTHTHTGPITNPKDAAESTLKYIDFLREKIKEAARQALADLTDAKMGYGTGKAERISFNRRYLMKDGSIQTNPGVNNPEIEKSLGDTDETVSVLRFDRTDGKHYVLVNFATHPDVVGGSLISADWPGLSRATLEKTLDDVKCIFFNGAEGDVNHVNVHPVGGDFNDMFNDFDDVARGYEHARHMAYVVSGAVLQCYQKMVYKDVDKITALEKIINVPAQTATPEQLAQAHIYNDLHNAGKDDEIPFKGMMLTTVVAEAGRMVRLENGPDSFEMSVCAVKLGDVALVTIPGEGFVNIGLELKKNNNCDIVIPLGLTNGYQGYFPMMENFNEGGYEARSSSFKAGVAELMIKTGNELIDSLK